MKPVPAGHVRISWTTTVTTDYSTTVPLTVLSDAGLSPTHVAAGTPQARSGLDRWLAGHEDQPAPRYQLTTGREITSVDWPPGQPAPPAPGFTTTPQ